MKRMISLVLVSVSLAVAFAVASTNEVTSVNVVGYAKYNLPPSGKYVATALNFDPFDPTLMGAFGTNQLTQDSKKTKVDDVLFYDAASQQFVTYGQKPDGKFYLKSDWNGSDTNPPVASGMGVFVRSFTGAADTNELVMMGEAVDVLTQSVDVVVGYNLLCYPFSSEVTFAELDFENDGATADSKKTKCDRILVYDSDTQAFTPYGLHSPSLEWRRTDDFSTPSPETNIIPLAAGLFYQAKAPFTWTETNKYVSSW